MRLKYKDFTEDFEIFLMKFHFDFKASIFERKIIQNLFFCFKKHEKVVVFTSTSTLQF
jgi:hypothetical protein